MLETSNLVRKYISICNFIKYIFQCLGPLNFVDISIFFLEKNSVFCPKKYHYSKQQCESCARDFLVLFSVFLRQKVTVTENITSADSSEFGLQTAPNWPKIRKMTMTSQFPDMTSSSIFFTLFCFSCQVQLLVQVPCQYRHWFWNYNNFLL